MNAKVTLRIMKSFLRIVVLFSGLSPLLSLPAAFGAETSVTTLVVLDLAEGSRIVGTPKIKNVSIKTSFAEMSVPLELVREINWDRESSNVVAKMQNGDTITGLCGLRQIEVFQPASVRLSQPQT